jgi:nucleoid-associated protein YgaU
VLKLGNFIFDIDDYPEEAPIGGASLVSVEKYPGGKKSIQNFGAFDDPITLKGTFMYQGAHAKAGTIDGMWRSGQPYQLIAGTLNSRWVVITSCKLTYRNDYEIPYEITLEPISASDPNSILYSSPQTSSSANASPSTSGGTTPTKSAALQRTYVVVSGDSLWKIAQKFYGDGSKFTTIQTANNIKDPSRIPVGMKLVIP